MVKGSGDSRLRQLLAAGALILILLAPYRSSTTAAAQLSGQGISHSSEVQDAPKSKDSGAGTSPVVVVGLALAGLATAAASAGKATLELLKARADRRGTADSDGKVSAVSVESNIAGITLLDKAGWRRSILRIMGGAVFAGAFSVFTVITSNDSFFLTLGVAYGLGAYSMLLRFFALLPRGKEPWVDERVAVVDGSWEDIRQRIFHAFHDLGAAVSALDSQHGIIVGKTGRDRLIGQRGREILSVAARKLDDVEDRYQVSVKSQSIRASRLEANRKNVRKIMGRLIA